MSSMIRPNPTEPIGVPDAGAGPLEAALMRRPGQPRALTGDRPTGPLHLGHYFGTLANRVRLQDLGVDVLVLVADYQTIIDRDSPESLPRDVEELVADYLAVGVDLARARANSRQQRAHRCDCLGPILEDRQGRRTELRHPLGLTTHHKFPYSKPALRP